MEQIADSLKKLLARMTKLKGEHTNHHRSCRHEKESKGILQTFAHKFEQDK